MKWRDAPLISEAADTYNLFPSEVVCGMARGADHLGKLWAAFHGVPVVEFPADWDKYKKAAGHIRNAQMAEYGDALLIFIWDESRGSMNMLEQMGKLGKPTYPIYNGVIA